ncbi:MAG: hypothetical protein JXB14_02980 [Candidatus Altiarchaeota archaeon]|nr:hypothetical protein [Candidatus Altiarchaeota archaeon]
MMEISEKRLVIGISAIFILGILFAYVSGEYSSSTGEQLPFEVYIIAIASMVVGAFVVILFRTKRSQGELGRVLNILPYDERVVVKILLENNNKIEQNYLVVLSGFNKVKISRIVAKLQDRGVLEKKDLGNTNYLILKI